MTAAPPIGRPPAREERLSPTDGATGIKRRLDDWPGAVAAALLGMAVVWYAFGGHILPPSHTGWMLTGTIGPDPVQYWLGYTFFKHSPWMWPPGLNPAYGMELGSSIFYADSIPLLAFAFKALHPLVEVSQYWGLWLFACGALQGALGWALLGLATRDPLARLAGSVLFVMQPTLLNRMGGHFALSAHFLILAGLWLCLKRSEAPPGGGGDTTEPRDATRPETVAAKHLPTGMRSAPDRIAATPERGDTAEPPGAARSETVAAARLPAGMQSISERLAALPGSGGDPANRRGSTRPNEAASASAPAEPRTTPARAAWGLRRTAAWAVLVLLASLIHSYILPMVLGLWAADWLARAVEQRGCAPLTAEALAVPLSGIAGLWAGGFFALRTGHGGQGARFGEMQLDLLAPFDPSFWGAFLPDLPGPDHLEVGSSYAGLGVLLLLVAAGTAWLRRPLPGLSARWPLLLALCGMLAIAITHRVSIGGWQITLFELPPILAEPAAALRASERFLWPLAYTLLVAAVAALAHGAGGRRAGLALAALAVVQFADLQPGFARLDRFFPTGPAVAPLRLSDPFWAEAARHYRRIRVVPNGNQAANWEEVAVFAATLGLETDAVYLARIDPARIAALNAEMAARLAEGRYEPDTLYTLGDEAALALARQGMDPSRDYLAQFDRVTVLAPDWWRRTGRAPPPPSTGR